MRPAGLFSSVGLGDGDKGEPVLALLFKLDIIEQIAGGTIDLVEEQGVELDGVLLRVGDQFLERLALIALARGLRDAEEALTISPPVVSA
ncbi:MAG: hypothetical protein R3B46_12410 [Phycisphaerales bacterium]